MVYLVIVVVVSVLNLSPSDRGIRLVRFAVCLGSVWNLPLVVQWLGYQLVVAYLCDRCFCVDFGLGNQFFSVAWRFELNG